MRCPICDQALDHTQSRPTSESQSCPLCRAICREAFEAEQGAHGVQGLAGSVLAADRPLSPTKRTPGVEDVFNWY